jgi:hypothetical protein
MGRCVMSSVGWYEAQKYPEPCEDAPEVVPGGRESGICGIAGTSLEIAAPEVALLLHVSDEGLDVGLKRPGFVGGCLV